MSDVPRKYRQIKTHQLLVVVIATAVADVTVVAGGPGGGPGICPGESLVPRGFFSIRGKFYTVFHILNWLLLRRPNTTGHIICRHTVLEAVPPVRTLCGLVWSWKPLLVPLCVTHPDPSLSFSFSLLSLSFSR